MINEHATLTGTGQSTPLRADAEANDFAMSFSAVVNGTVTYSIEHTLDEVTWFPSSQATAQTGNAFGNYNYPVQSLRINTASGTGTVTLTLFQRG